MYKDSKQCSICYRKSLQGKTHPMFGSNHNGHKNPHWRGISLLHFCKDCSCHISKTSYYGQGRCKSCARKYQYKTRPKTHPAYIDGNCKCKYPSIFNNKLKEQIRNRDRYTCQNCGMTKRQQWLWLKWQLPVHHIDYNKENCGVQNLITLCNRCNIKANSNRSYWKLFYKEKIGVIYGK
jgi:hypothetical protein